MVRCVGCAPTNYLECVRLDSESFLCSSPSFPFSFFFQMFISPTPEEFFASRSLTCSLLDPFLIFLLSPPRVFFLPALSISFSFFLHFSHFFFPTKAQTITKTLFASFFIFSIRPFISFPPKKNPFGPKYRPNVPWNMKDLPRQPPRILVSTHVNGQNHYPEIVGRKVATYVGIMGRQHILIGPCYNSISLLLFLLLLMLVICVYL